MRAGLDDAVFGARGVDHAAAFEHGQRQWLLAVDVFAGLAGVDGGQRVPVVGRGDGDGVDVFAVEDAAVVAVAFAGVALVGDLLEDFGEVILVDVADRGGDGAGFHQVVEVADALPADANVRGDDPLVRARTRGYGTKYGAATAAAPAARNWRRERRVVCGMMTSV